MDLVTISALIGGNNVATTSATNLALFNGRWYGVTDAEATIVAALIGGLLTIVGWGLAAWIAFKQIKGNTDAQIKANQEQFKYNLYYEGWKNIQGHIFEYSKSLTEYDARLTAVLFTLRTLDYSIRSLSIKELHQAIIDLDSLWEKVGVSFIEIIRSYEGHEIFFNKLENMKNALMREHDELRKRHMDFTQFFLSLPIVDLPREEGRKYRTKLESEINKSIEINSTMIAYALIDFRRELQNTVFSPILKEKLPERKPEEGKGHKILTLVGYKEIK